MGMWVPQAPPPAAPPPPPPSRYTHAVQQFEPSSMMGFGDQTINGSSLAVENERGGSPIGEEGLNNAYSRKSDFDLVNI